jgi:predicted anti-sigma-YlaC factor YlaD
MLSSLALDGEIDALAERELGRHLRECPRCALVARRYGALTALLRDAPLAVPERPVAPPRARRAAARSLVAAAAIGAITAVGLTSLAGSAGRGVVAHSTPVLVSNVAAVTAGDPQRLSMLAHRVSV